MIGVAMNNGDLVISGYGDLSLHITDDDNVIQMANSAIYTIKGENIFHSEYGNDAWNKRLKIAESGFSTVESCAKDAILHALPEVMDVKSIKATKGEGYGECNINYTLVTFDGRTISGSTHINIL